MAMHPCMPCRRGVPLRAPACALAAVMRVPRPGGGVPPFPAHRTNANERPRNARTQRHARVRTPPAARPPSHLLLSWRVARSWCGIAYRGGAHGCTPEASRRAGPAGGRSLWRALERRVRPALKEEKKRKRQAPLPASFHPCGHSLFFRDRAAALSDTPPGAPRARAFRRRRYGPRPSNPLWASNHGSQQPSWAACRHSLNSPTLCNRHGAPRGHFLARQGTSRGGPRPIHLDPQRPAQLPNAWAGAGGGHVTQ